MRSILALTTAVVLLTVCAPIRSQAEDGTKRCVSLAKQWEAAKIAKASSPKLGAAKVWAKSAARDCAKDTQSRRADGANEYIKALNLVGMPPK